MTTTVTQARQDDGYETAEWSSLIQNETGDRANMGRIPGIKTVQITGGFSTATVTLQGSMDGVTWFTLNAVDYVTNDWVPISAIATNFMAAIVENPRYVRPVVTNSGTPSIKVVVGGNSRM